MRESAGTGGEPLGGEPLVPGGETAGAGDAPSGLPALRLTPNITAAEATAVFRRKLPGARVEVREVFHPFWWTVLAVETRGLFARRKTSESRGAAGRRINVLVNARSGKGYLADFEPQGAVVDAAEWQQATGPQDQTGPVITSGEAVRTARSLVRTKVVKTVKLGMDISIAEAAAPREVLKPNWLVTGSNAKHSATILVDGLDSSHYIVRVAKLEAG